MGQKPDENFADRLNKQPEAKEREKAELEKAGQCCAKYHQELDSTRYFDSDAISKARSLLHSFRNLNKDLLPPAVKNVIQHRLIYLNFITSLNPAIGSFLDSVKQHVGDLGLLLKKPEELYERVKNNDKFKALTPLDLTLIKSSAHIGRVGLDAITTGSGGNWGQQAEALLKPSGKPGTDNRIDDQLAAANLQQGFGKIEEFVTYALSKIARPAR